VFRRDRTCSIEQGADLSGDLKILARAEDERPGARLRQRHVGVAAAAGVAPSIDREAEEAKARDRAGADLGRVFAHTASEYEGV
jgi:hypothetical protein